MGKLIEGCESKILIFPANNYEKNGIPDRSDPFIHPYPLPTYCAFAPGCDDKYDVHYYLYMFSLFSIICEYYST